MTAINEAGMLQLALAVIQDGLACGDKAVKQSIWAEYIRLKQLLLSVNRGVHNGELCLEEALNEPEY